MLRKLRLTAVVLAMVSLANPATADPAHKLIVSASTAEILDQIYAGRTDLAMPGIRLLQQQAAEDPLGYLLEAEADWWRIWCESAEFKYGMNVARHHDKEPSDQHYLDLTTKAYALAQAKLRQHDDGEMHLYAAMADALAARLYGLRGEYRATARAGVRARQNFLDALQLDPTLTDADTGLGLYNYYVDTLSVLARALRFLMGIPGGSKEEGIRQLQRGIAEGQLSSPVARFYLALNLFNYDQRYEQALRVITPLADKYPSNPLFPLMQGDLNAKLGRKQLAEHDYHAADAAANDSPDPRCRDKIKQLVRQSLEALRAKP